MRLHDVDAGTAKSVPKRFESTPQTTKASVIARERSAPPEMTPSPPDFDQSFLHKLDDLLAWRRDVRHFKTDPVDERLLDEILDRACLAPSVGNSQPWRFVRVVSDAARTAVIEDFERCNARALTGYSGDQAKLYAGLKLAGLREAPVHMAVFTDITTTQGHGLGQATMPQMLHYSTACMIMSLWLIARARGVGIGWVSIVDPSVIAQVLDVPAGWELSAYLCIGHAQNDNDTPELERVGWQSRDQGGRRVWLR